MTGRILHNVWQEIFLPVSAFPVPAQEIKPVAEFLNRLSEAVSSDGRWEQIVYIQAWKLSDRAGADIFRDCVQQWKPRPGLGIQLGRPPQDGAEDRFDNASAAALSGEEPRLSSYRLLRLDVEKRDTPGVADKIRGFGAQITVFSRHNAVEIEKRAKSIHASRVEGQATKTGFYFPVLDRATVLSSRSAEELEHWLCGVDIYVRESAEAQGILILSRFSLDPFFPQA